MNSLGVVNSRGVVPGIFRLTVLFVLVFVFVMDDAGGAFRMFIFIPPAAAEEAAGVDAVVVIVLCTDLVEVGLGLSLLSGPPPKK